ncbi:restriction endonuclease [Actinokineospora diospyrosa]|uniref:Restriction endonuclease n=1 Tax=Actinokineospora diospyrosa TaxID=103728 RepID=A0ABT1IE10_9PSEU|nr:restriction endonuclease [Actinokineospora diospyrosa]MCP2270854.1 Restriction endonuclease [Actinokineospora diospyrosa]
MSEFEVEVDVEHEDLVDLCECYWETDGAGSFVHTVKTIAEKYRMASYKVTKTVGEICVARSLRHHCQVCGVGFEYRSRSEWSSTARLAAARCRDCVDAEKREQEDERRRMGLAMRDAIISSIRVVDQGRSLRAEDLDLASAFALAAIFEDAEEVSSGVSTPLGKRVDRLTPLAELDFELVSTLVDLRVVHLHPSSTSDSFTWNGDGSLGSSHYPVLVSYYMTGVGSVGSRVAAYQESLSRVLKRECWPDHWVDQFSEFWFKVAAAECKAYLVYTLKQHGLDFTPGQKTDDVIRRALRWYSIGQVYYFIWRAAKASAAYRARDKVSAKQAANSAVTRISADIDRAYAQGWQVSTYRRDSRLPMSTLSHILFSRALVLDDPMSYSPMDLPARRAGLALSWTNLDSGTFERLIFQLIAETEGYENVDWLMHTNAPDHGRDVSAVRLRRDPLSGHSSQRVAIQCKHWTSKPVRDHDVSQAVVSISHWQDPPFDVVIIATSGRLTSDAVSWIERHNLRSGRPIVEVWNDARLELLLSDRPHLIRSYELR